MNKLIEELIELALIEDLGDGDHTSLSCIPAEATGKAQLIVKQEGIIAGIEIAELIFKKLDPNIFFKNKITDGSKVKHGDIAFFVEGRVHIILQAERLVLNIMQRMSGIATQTSQYVERLKGLKTKILDTRKTTPGMRMLDKAAVKYGGGENHRMGLYDMILIKDNHIDFAGGIENAIRNTKKYLDKKKLDLKIEIEARNINDVKQILKVGGIDFIMLDNFSIEDTRNAVKIINNKYKIESSGGITLHNLRDYAECGVDFISIGALTHQTGSIDLSLKALDF
ncbi:MAG: carboxylating nicotinate-nucleotide diphosphorylase [Bacteroidales bacterium]|nr:carboxylating nicotinate-nucleotide diphosphorylase [Bacteroidales bacterium]